MSFPRGRQYTPVTYGIGAGYIHPDTTLIDVCYRFITEIARRPELGLGIPAFESLLNDQEFIITAGEDIAEAAQYYATVLNEPNTVALPGYLISDRRLVSLGIPYLWLEKAINQYLISGSDLAIELTSTQEIIDNYFACLRDKQNGENTNYFDFESAITCAESSDPSFSLSGE